ncbi:MAG: DUF1840 domain-containing protein [Thauera sp.]|jgi:hypothetical protein|nr:DUF1840 domain-containing protein [Thauera sp.]
MLYTFSSAASADVLMFEAPAKHLIKLMGKDSADRQGIVTVVQLPAAVQGLQAAIEEERARLAERNQEADEAADREAGRTGMQAPVNLAQRAWPLLDMLQTALKEEVVVTWKAG